MPCRPVPKEVAARGARRDGTTAGARAMKVVKYDEGGGNACAEARAEARVAAARGCACGHSQRRVIAAGR